MLHTASLSVCRGGVSLGESLRTSLPSELRLPQDSFLASSISASQARAASGDTPAEEREEWEEVWEVGLTGSMLDCWEAR